MNTSYDFYIPIDALANHLLKGRRLQLLGSTCGVCGHTVKF